MDSEIQQVEGIRLWQPRGVVPAADKHPALVYLASLNSASGRRSMQSTLEGVAQMLSSGKANMLTLDWAALSFQHVAAIRAQLVAEGKAPASVNRVLAALRGTAKASWLLGYSSAEQYEKVRQVKGVKGSRLPRGRELSAGELSSLFRKCVQDATPLGARDACLLALLFGAGLRRSEVSDLQLSDYADGVLKVRGKGNKERLQPIDNGARDALEDWLRARGDAPGPLLWPSGEGKGRLLVNRRMDPTSIYAICARRAQEADVPAFAPHSLRRSYLTALLRGGVDVLTVSKLAGHADLSTTARYDMRGEDTKRQAARTVHVPYRRPEVVVTDPLLPEIPTADNDRTIVILKRKVKK
ncbi:MAG: tyrosine-type recombinase/integrase [Anaerolineales bacterium]|jgi:site-specific recombinase XerD